MYALRDLYSFPAAAASGFSAKKTEIQTEMTANAQKVLNPVKCEELH
jgi:hypothetical protein